MSNKRGASGYSLVVGVDKPAGMTSHDVVNACRRIFGERRVGHTGTLDPLATGVLPICIGPATRLDAYLTGHTKTYEARISFGASTDTDDAQGAVVERSQVPTACKDKRIARGQLARMVGSQKQIPPAYSAIKVQGQKAYKAARAGNELHLEPRDIVVYEAECLDISFDEVSGYLNWDVLFTVSAGTYIRALARDLGVALSCPAHIASLRRTRVGLLEIAECFSLEALEACRSEAALDPVRLLGFRVAFIKGDLKQKLANGNSFSAYELELFELQEASFNERLDSCSSQLRPSLHPPKSAELLSLVADGKLSAVYYFNEIKQQFCAKTVFAQGVSRG